MPTLSHSSIAILPFFNLLGTCRSYDANLINLIYIFKPTEYIPTMDACRWCLLSPESASWEMQGKIEPFWAAISPKNQGEIFEEGETNGSGLYFMALHSGEDERSIGGPKREVAKDAGHVA